MPVEIAQLPSLSVYRGQSRSGQGEGPGKAVLHGEQYLRVDAALYETNVLDAIRPWMTLDSDPADHQRLEDQLEAWSLFTTDQYLFVVRLASAGRYDRRAGSYAHGRAWRLDALPPGFDPGLHLGRVEAFDPPWRDDFPGHSQPEIPPVLPRIESLRTEKETAASFLGHLLQGIMDGAPLIIAAPLADFVSGNTLPALVSLARGGLPARLRNGCRIRIYSRMPDIFLRHLGANLVVVPEDTASVAVAARPQATLLDRRGCKLAGKEMSALARDYATAVVESALDIPESLPWFSERLRDVPSSEDARTISVSYNLGHALSLPRERRARFLHRYLPPAADRLGPGIAWDHILGAEEWRSFPGEAVLDLVLSDSRDASAGRRELLRAAEDGAARIGLFVDDRLRGWWNPDDPAKLQRLLELLDHGLVREEAATERTAQIPLARLAQAGSLSAVLRAEAKCGKLAQRGREGIELALAAHDSGIFRLLSEAVSANRLDPLWARDYVRTATPEKVVEAAEAWLGDARFLKQEWTAVNKPILDQLRTLASLPERLRPLILQAGERLHPTEHLDVYLRLADLLSRFESSAATNSLIDALLPLLGDSAKQDFIESIAFDPAWRCLDITRLETGALLQLAAIFQREASLTRLYAELDARMESNPDPTTAALARSGWWYFWRRNTQVGAATRTRSALAWLAHASGTDVTREAWTLALEDLPQTLPGEKFAELRTRSATGKPWPWIPAFEQDQCDEMLLRASDLGALAEIVEASTPWQGDQPLHEYALSVWSHSKLETLPHNALAWLLEGIPRPALDLAQSAALHRYAGHRQNRALAARVSAIAPLLESSPRQALTAANNPSLWNEAKFATQIANWMSTKSSIAEMGGLEVAKMINVRLVAEPATRPQARSAALMKDLRVAGLLRVAALLTAKSQPEGVLRALLMNDATDRSWKELAAEVKRASPNEAVGHPLFELAKQIRGTELLPREREALSAYGWERFLVVAKTHRELTSSLLIIPNQPATMLPLLSFAASLLGDGSLGNAALQLVFAAGPSFLTSAEWWHLLLEAIEDAVARQPSADDRYEAAVAALFAYVEDPEYENALFDALGAGLMKLEKSRHD
ncbi:MAG: hypothetical protein JOZ54_25290 [Acidobacteria bacterium]|nr:hypothetical protein [Acidobacteriota bacterium]